MARRSKLDVETAEPAEIYDAVKLIDGDEFDDLMADPSKRPLVIEAMIDHLVGLFQPDAAGDLEAIIHVKLWDRPEGGYDHYELLIADRTCVISAAPVHEPRLTLKIRPGDLRRLVTGETGARRLAFKGRLRALGDLRLGMKLPDLFRFENSSSD